MCVVDGGGYTRRGQGGLPSHITTMTSPKKTLTPSLAGGPALPHKLCGLVSSQWPRHKQLLAPCSWRYGPNVLWGRPHSQ